MTANEKASNMKIGADAKFADPGLHLDDVGYNRRKRL